MSLPSFQTVFVGNPTDKGNMTTFYKGEVHFFFPKSRFAARLVVGGKGKLLPSDDPSAPLHADF